MGAGQIELSCLKWGKKLMVFLLLEWILLACCVKREEEESVVLFFSLCFCPFYGPKMQKQFGPSGSQGISKFGDD